MARFDVCANAGPHAHHTPWLVEKPRCLAGKRTARTVAALDFLFQGY